VRRAAEPIDDLVTSVAERVLARERTGLLAPEADAGPAYERLSMLRARGEEIASMLGDPDSGMTAAQFKVANERLEGEIRATEAKIGRLTAGSALGEP
jgi:hypothetical protein